MVSYFSSGVAILLVVASLCLRPVQGAEDPSWLPAAPVKGALRVATYNVSLHRKQSGEMIRDLEGENEQARRLAKIVQTVQPDILIVNEIDYDSEAKGIALFRDKYLNQTAGLGSNRPAVPFEYYYAAEVNTGQPSGMDLNQNGKTGETDDCWGFGAYPGQYGMAVYSRYPLRTKEARTFQKLLWSKVPSAKRPMKDKTQPFYPDDVWNKLRLSSKSHWDLVVDTPGCSVHVLVSHPTPPVFDGPEDRNGCRNHDEIRFWSDYIGVGKDRDYIVDDQGKAGTLAEGEAFVLCGDLNADPQDGAGMAEAINGLLDNPKVTTYPAPASEGAEEASAKQAGANTKHKSPAKNDTADFNDRSSGNLRCDFLIPSAKAKVVGSGVFWPTAEQLEKVDKGLLEASDHRMVWIDLLWE